VLSLSFVGGCATSTSQSAERDSIFSQPHPKSMEGLGGKLVSGIEGRLNGSSEIIASTRDFLEVDGALRKWERTTFEAASGSVRDFIDYLFGIMSDDEYELRPYERSMLGFYLALNHMLAGRSDLASVEARKIAFRETYAESLARVEASALKQHESFDAGLGGDAAVTTDIRMIPDYPVERIDSPDVLRIRNSYQNPAANILSGFIFEANGDFSLATPAYIRALELLPNSEMLRASLENVGKRKNGFSDLLIIVEVGDSIGFHEEKYKFEVFTSRGFRSARISLPVPNERYVRYPSPEVSVNDDISLDGVSIDLDAYMLREIKDMLPMYLAFATTKALLQMGSQEGVSRFLSSLKNHDYGLTQFIGSKAVDWVFSKGELDTRYWFNLPSKVQIYRSRIRKGVESEVSLGGGLEKKTVKITPTEDFSVVNFRIASEYADNNSASTDIKLASKYYDDFFSGDPEYGKLGYLKCLGQAIRSLSFQQCGHQKDEE